MIDILFRDSFDDNLIFPKMFNANLKRIATLGPPGTSSEYVAMQLCEIIANEVALFESFEAVANFVIQDVFSESLLLVANAYSKINLFYISNFLIPVACFFYRTPPYVLASQVSNLHEKLFLKVGSHPAPSHLIAPLLANQKFEIIEISSTSLAAKMVANSELDLCLTTQPASELYNLHVYKHATQHIEMLWTLFAKRSRSSE